MNLSDVTPDWIAARRDALGLKDVDIYEEVGLEQDKFSKSMNGKRRFSVGERERIVAYLTSSRAAAKLPLVAEAMELMPELAEEDQAAAVQLLRRLADRKRGAS